MPSKAAELEGNDFAGWYQAFEPRLRVALVAAYGPDRGREAAAEALAWAWEHQDRLAGLREPVGYLYRVGQSRTRLRRLRTVYARSEWSEPWVEPALKWGLESLSRRQRLAVILVYAYGWTLSEVAELGEVKVTTVQNHLERGLARLRSILEVTEDD